MPTQIRISEYLLETGLQGRALGRRHLLRLCAGLTSDVSPGGFVLLNFDGVEIVTASWIDECLVPLLGWSADYRNDFFPLIVNFEDPWIDDLCLVAKWTHNCFVLLREGGSDIVGSLDDCQKATLDIVQQSKSGVTGASLDGRGGVKATAWNNRLKDLYRKRLVIREKRGREQVYFSTSIRL